MICATFHEWQRISFTWQIFTELLLVSKHYSRAFVCGAYILAGENNEQET